MAINVACQCGKAFRVKDEVGGKRVKCPGCGRVLDIPEQSAPVLLYPEPQQPAFDPLGLPTGGAWQQGPDFPPQLPRRGSNDGLVKVLVIVGGACVGLMMLLMAVLTIVSAVKSSSNQNDQLAMRPEAAPAPPGQPATAPTPPSLAPPGVGNSNEPAPRVEAPTIATNTSPVPAIPPTVTPPGESSDSGREKSGPQPLSKEARLPALSRASIERLGKGEALKGVQVAADKLPMQGYSWMVQLLPYLGHEEHYKKFDFSKRWDEDPNTPLAGEIIPAFLNPSDPRERWEGYPFENMALTHFVGVSGIEDQRNVVAASLPRSDPRAGMFGYEHVAKPAEVTDGTSQTIMLIGSGEVAAPWVQGGGATIRGAREPYFHEITGFGSKGLPKRGAQAVMADGSVRFISADIDPGVFKSMCTIHGADSVDLSANPHVTAGP